MLPADGALTRGPHRKESSCPAGLCHVFLLLWAVTIRHTRTVTLRAWPTTTTMPEVAISIEDPRANDIRRWWSITWRNHMPVYEDRSDITRFAHVDATGDAGSLIAFLDTANALAGLRAAKQALLDQLRLGQARSVLDVGCGTGADLIAMAERLPQGGRAAGIDVSESMIAEARRRVSGLDLTISLDTGDAATLPYQDASFGA